MSNFSQKIKQKYKRLFLQDSPTLQRDLLVQYVSNHSTNKIGVPLACLLISAMLLQWEDPVYVGIWFLLSLAFTSILASVFKTIGDGSQVTVESLPRWYAMIAVPRFLFILTWASMGVWAWDPAQPETFFVLMTVLMSTMAMNASQSGPVLPLYFMEMIPKLAALLFTLIVYQDSFQHTHVAIGLCLLGGVFFTKIAFAINESTHMLFAQKNELARAKEEVEQASRAKSSFLATMSHEVRTPLNGVLGIIGLLKDTPLNRQQDEYVETIRYSGETLLTMLNDILDFSKMEAGKLDLENVSFDTSKLIKSVINLMWSRAAEKKINIQYEIDATVPPFINTDATRLRQILLNLMGNAIKFTERGGVMIRVSAEDEDYDPFSMSSEAKETRLRFEVIDTGIGIPAAAKECLFNDFTQVDSSISRRFGGTGLGLSICRHIVQLMGGAIGFESSEGKGSTFWFEIPVTIAEEETTASHYNDKDLIPAFEPLKILLAEDNKINQKVVIGLLSKYGHTIFVAEDGQAAVDAVQKDRYDVVLMDMQMPVVDGLQATQMIKALGEKYADLPIIALTANAMRGDDERCMAAGMVDHVSKPIRPIELFSALARHLPHKVIVGANALNQPLALAVTPRLEAIDLSNLRELERSLGTGFIDGFMTESLEEMQKLSESMSLSFEKSNKQVLQMASHDLKGLSAMCGMKDISYLAEGIEMCCQQDKIDEAVQLFDKLKARLDPDLAALRSAYDKSAVHKTRM